MAINKQKSHTLPSSPIHHHSSSSDFEFTVSHHHPKSTATNLRPADELFYNGQLLPLHLSPHNSMVQNLLTTTSRRHSSDNHSSFSYETSDSSRPSSATDEENHIIPHKIFDLNPKNNLNQNQSSFKRFSSVFRKESSKPTSNITMANNNPITTLTMKEKIQKYFKKAKPLYKKLSRCSPTSVKKDNLVSSSFSGNVRFSSCPSTRQSSPNHSGVLCTNRLSSTEELHSAIQGAILHCKNSMTAQ